MGESSVMHQDLTITIVYSSKRKISMKTRSTVFLAITILITLLTQMQHKKEPTVTGNLVPQPLKLLANIFLRYIYLVTCRLQSWSLVLHVHTSVHVDSIL